MHIRSPFSEPEPRILVGTGATLPVVKPITVPGNVAVSWRVAALLRAVRKVLR